MNNIYVKVIGSLFACIAANISHAAEECKRESSQLKAINGLKIGAPLEEYKDTYLFNEESKQGKSIPPVKRRFVSLESKINSIIYFEGTDNLVSKISYKFEKGKFKNSSEMAYYVSIMLNLPKKGWDGSGNSMVMKCKDFTVNLELGSPRHSSILFPSLVVLRNTL